MNDAIRPASSPARGWRRDLLSTAIMLALLLVGRASFADHYRVPSGSMLPTVEVGDRVVVNKAAYGLRVPFSDRWLSDVSTPQRGDVVVVTSPEDGRVLLKRVVAVGGDRVQIRHGRIVLNGELMPTTPSGQAAQLGAGGEGAGGEGAGGTVGEAAGGTLERLDAGTHPVALGYGGPDFGPATVPTGQLLLVGDNRGNSHDSRSFGFVDERALLGRAMAVYLRDGSPNWLKL